MPAMVILFRPTSLKLFAQMFQSVMNPSNVSLSVGYATHPEIRKMTWETWSFHLPRSLHPPRIFSWISCRSSNIPLTKHVSSFDKAAADTWQRIHVSHWTQCGLLALKAWAENLTSSGDTVAGWASTLPASAGSTHSGYGSVEMPCCGRGDWNGSQPVQCYAKHGKLNSSKTSASGCRSWGQELSCRVLGWMVSLKHWHFWTQQCWPLRTASDFQVTVIFKQRNSNKGQIG